MVRELAACGMILISAVMCLASVNGFPKHQSEHPVQMRCFAPGVLGTWGFPMCPDGYEFTFSNI